MCDVFAFFYIILYFLSRYLSVDFFGIFTIKLNSIFFLRLRTRYLSVKSPVLLKFTFFGRDAENELLIDSFLSVHTWPYSKQ